MKLLCLDLAGQSGWALWGPDMGKPKSGTIKLPKLSLGQSFAVYRDWLMGRVIGEGVTHIWVESPFLKTGRESNAKKLLGLYAITNEVCFRKNLKFSESTAGEWRSLFIGAVAAPKEIREDTRRRQWLKDKAVRECLSRGWQVETDDEAEALGLLAFARRKIFPQFASEGGLFGYDTPARPHPESVR